MLEKYIVRLREDDEYFVAAAEYAFDNALQALQKIQPTANQRAKNAAQRAKKAAALAKAVTIIKSGVVLISWKMPNGKKLRDCTKEECEHFGGWFKQVAAKLGPKDTVADVFNEEQLRALYKVA